MLKIGDIITNGFQIGLKYFLPLLVNYVLWIITIWIPYLNVGTTIGIVAIAAKISKGQPISMTEIFNPAYRKEMGNFFLACAFVGMGVGIGFIFLFIPGFVIAIAWSLAILLVVDKGMEPMAAIKKSNEVTYGKKWTIFFGQFFLGLILAVAAGIAGWILSLLFGFLPGVINSILMTIVSIGIMALIGSIMTGAAAYIYGNLAK